jgi:hypothetical protein
VDVHALDALLRRDHLAFLPVDGGEVAASSPDDQTLN